MFSDDRKRIWIPFGKFVTLGDFVTFFDKQVRTIRDTMFTALTTLIIFDDKFHVTAHHNVAALTVNNHIVIVDLKRTFRA